MHGGKTWASVVLYSAGDYFQLIATVKKRSSEEFFTQALDFDSVMFPQDWLKFCLTKEIKKLRLAANGNL